MKLVVFVIGLGLIALTAMSRVRSARWWIRSTDFPRLQIAVALLLTGIAFAFLLDPSSVIDVAFATALVASLGYQCYRIFPYTPIAPTQVVDAAPGDDARLIRILIFNVMITNRRADDFIALVADHGPDVILTAETDAWWDAQLRVLDGDYPHSIRQPQSNSYGLHLFSKLELNAPEVRFLVADDVPSIRVDLRLRSGDMIEFNGLHPRPPRPQQDTEQRDAELLIVGRLIKADPKPAIVAGDLNDVAWSHTTRLFQRISGMLDPRRGRGMFNTFNARYPFFRWPLDHVFHDQSFTLVRLERLANIGSDHFPVLVELKYDPQPATLQEPPHAAPEDHEEAMKLIAEGSSG